MSSILIALGAAVIAQPVYLGHEQYAQRVVATPPPIVTKMPVNGAYIAQLGRTFEGRTLVGTTPRYPYPWGNPGPAAYGVAELDGSVVYARIDSIVVSVSPWVRIDGMGPLETMEQARGDWLKEQGFTGGVRHFRPIARPGDAADEASSWKDRYKWRTIEIPRGSKPRFEVNADPAPQRFIRTAKPDRIVVVSRTRSADQARADR